MALSSPVALAWYRAIQGEIPPEEAAALMDSETEREHALQVFAPVTPERREQHLAALLRRLADDGPDREDGGSPGKADGDASLDELPQAKTSARHGLEARAEVLRPRWWVRGWSLALVAVAAALVLVVVLPRAPRDVAMDPAGYELDPLLGSTGFRSAPPSLGEAPTYLLDGKLVLVLRPERAVSGAVGVVAFGRDSAARVVRLAVEPEVDPSSGVVTVAAPIRDTGLGVGEWELFLVVGRPDALPSSWHAFADAYETDDLVGYEVVRQRLNVVTTLTGP